MSGHPLSADAKGALRPARDPRDVEQEFIAEEVLDRIEAAFELLADNPGIGRMREEIALDSSVRFWRVGAT